MVISSKQIQQVQTILSKQELDRDERLQFLSTHFKREITTTKDLTSIEADDLIYFLNTGKKTTSNWAFFDKAKFSSERKLLWSYLYQAQWVVKNEKYNEVPDLERLSNFLKSPKSPVNKPLKKWNKAEWSKILHAFRNIVKFQYK
jgi:hypothetical protein